MFFISVPVQTLLWWLGLPLWEGSTTCILLLNFLWRETSCATSNLMLVELNQNTQLPVYLSLLVLIQDSRVSEAAAGYISGLCTPERCDTRCILSELWGSYIMFDGAGLRSRQVYHAICTNSAFGQCGFWWCSSYQNSVMGTALAFRCAHSNSALCFLITLGFTTTRSALLSRFCEHTAKTVKNSSREELLEIPIL